MALISVTVYQKNNSPAYNKATKLNSDLIVNINPDSGSGSVIKYNEENSDKNTLYYVLESPSTISTSSNSTLSGDGFAELSAIEGGSEELVFDENKRYSLASADYAITIASSGHENTGKLTTIELFLSISDTDTVTLDLSDSSKDLYGVGFTESQPNEYLFTVADNSNSTRYHYIILKAINGVVISATSETAQAFVAGTFADIPDEPTNFFYLKNGTNIDDGDTFNWTDNVSGINISNGTAGKPTLNSGYLEFNGTNDGLELVNNTSISTLLSSLPALAAIHMTIKFPTLGTQVNPINIYDNSVNFRVYRPIILDATNVIKCVHRTANTNDTVTGTGTTSLSADTWYTISVGYQADNTVDVYLDGVLEISAIDLSTLTNQSVNFNSLGLGYKDLNGGVTYEECDISEVVMASSLSNFSNTMTKLIANQPA